jgi:hypothetical protein
MIENSPLMFIAYEFTEGSFPHLLPNQEYA